MDEMGKCLFLRLKGDLKKKLSCCKLFNRDTL